MTYVVGDQEEKNDQGADPNGEEKTRKLEEERIRRDAIDYFKMGTAVGMPSDSPVLDLESPMEPTTDKEHLADFLIREREHSEMVSVVVTCDQSESISSQSPPLDKAAAPLPSPDDHPWKQLSDTLLKKGLMDADRKNSDDSETQDSVTYQETPSNQVEEDQDGDTPTYTNEKEEAHSEYVNLVGAERVEDTPTYANVNGAELPEYVNVTDGAEQIEDPPTYANVKEDGLPGYVNVLGNQQTADLAVYENVESVGDLNEEDYVNITNLENKKISADFEKQENLEGK